MRMRLMCPYGSRAGTGSGSQSGSMKSGGSGGSAGSMGSEYPGEMGPLEAGALREVVP